MNRNSFLPFSDLMFGLLAIFIVLISILSALSKRLERLILEDAVVHCYSPSFFDLYLADGRPLRELGQVDLIDRVEKVAKGLGRTPNVLILVEKGCGNGFSRLKSASLKMPAQIEWRPFADQFEVFLYEWRARHEAPRDE
jgi:hypothetical protein